MIKTRLIGLVPNSKKYIFCNVMLQWIGMLSNVVMILAIVQLLGRLQSGKSLAPAGSFCVIISAVILRVCCLKLAAYTSYYA